MGTIPITLRNATYTVACPDSLEVRARGHAARLTDRVEALAKHMPHASTIALLLITALDIMEEAAQQPMPPADNEVHALTEAMHSIAAYVEALAARCEHMAAS